MINSLCFVPLKKGAKSLITLSCNLLITSELQKGLKLPLGPYA